jgi:hypothetical protein
VKCIAWNFDGSNVAYWDYELNKLRFENRQIIPNVEIYFVDNDFYKVYVEGDSDNNNEY